MKPTTRQTTQILAAGLALGLTASSQLRAFAKDKGMSGMGGMNMPAAAKPSSSSSNTASNLTIAATLKPNAPTIGDNTLDLVVTDVATKQPVTGLKLTASVAMTSMDMGTTKPTVKGTGNGHYTTTVNFSMAGPWRVLVQGQAANQDRYTAALNFEAGGKTLWQSPATAFARAAKAAGAQSSGMTMGGMNMGSMAGGDMAGMDMGGDSTPHEFKGMPQLQEKGVVTVAGNEDWKARTGFGHNAGMVAMMSQMMVGGSKMESMKMAPMKMDFGAANFTGEVEADANDTSNNADNKTTEAATSAQGSKTATPAPQAAPPADDATQTATAKPGATNTTPPVTGSGKGALTTVPLANAGDNATTAPATDAGKTNSTPSTDANPSNPATDLKQAENKKIEDKADPTASAAAVALPLKVTAKTTGAPKAGDNPLHITVLDAKGQPVAGAKITTSVAMTSMDMGTTHPAAKEAGKGNYSSTVKFSMAGPWRVTLKVTAPGQKPVAYNFDFTAK